MMTLEEAYVPLSWEALERMWPHRSIAKELRCMGFFHYSQVKGTPYESLSSLPNHRSHSKGIP